MSYLKVIVTNKDYKGPEFTEEHLNYGEVYTVERIYEDRDMSFGYMTYYVIEDMFDEDGNNLELSELDCMEFSLVTTGLKYPMGIESEDLFDKEHPEILEAIKVYRENN